MYFYVKIHEGKVERGFLMNFIKYIFFILLYIVCGFFLLLFSTIIQKTKGQQAAEKIVRPFIYSFSKNCFLWFGIKPEIAGLENLPEDSGYMLVCNHQSSLDAAVIMGFVTQSGYYVIKKEIEKIPFFNFLGKILGISIDRDNPRQAAGVIKKILTLLKSGEVIVMFPEGTRSPTGKLGEIKKGSLKIAMLAKVPVVPIAVSGTREVNPVGSMYIHKKPVKAIIFSPVDPSRFSNEEDFIVEITQIIESGISL